MKTQPEDLVEDIADQFHTYIGRGIRLEPLVRDIDPSLDIDDLEMLLRIHFVLTESTADDPGVIDFVEALPDRIRRLKTSVSHRTTVRSGEIKGRIDWQQTVKHRFRTPNPDPLEFVCQETEENFDIRENLVLKRLLSIIHQTITDDLRPALDAQAEFEWLAQWIEGNENLLRILDRTFHDNVYVREISTPEIVDHRTIQSVKQSRIPLYEEAAELLDRYNRLMAYDLHTVEAKELLRNGFVIPDRTELLFELYWIFKILSAFENVRFHVIRGAGNVVAEWSTDAARYIIYHDSTGGEEISFSESVAQVDLPGNGGYVDRMVSIIDRWQELSEQIFDVSGSGSLWGGRPDILIERYSLEGGDLESLFVGEVKYTQDRGYAAQGLRELLEYMAFVSDTNGYAEDYRDLFEEVRVKGALFVDRMDIKRPADGISVYQYGDDLGRFLEGKSRF